MTVVIHIGDCLEVLPRIAADSVHACVTDPPYGLGFMGKDWDHGIPGIHFWAEVLRVLKPGAHLVAFGGTRTFHRLTCAIEDAGFEIRDCLGWLYGSGFPKSLDVSKAIDKRGGNSHLTAEVGAAIKAARKSRGITVGEADARYCGGTTLWTWYEGRPAGQQLPTAGVMNAIAADWPELAKYAEAIAEAEREVIGEAEGTRLAVAPGQANDRSDRTLKLTTASTAAARQWAGWGTALKPAYEPVILAQKPLGINGELAILAPTIGGLICKVASFAKTDTPLSASLRASGFLSIATSLSGYLAALSTDASKCTTATAYALTTDLRILRSSLLRIMQAITTGDQNPTSGGASDALAAVGISASVLAKCERLGFTTAGELAIGSYADEASGQEESRLSPEWEHIILARKPFRGTVAANVQEHGTGALNIDGCRVEGEKPQVTQGINGNPSSFNVAKERRTSGPTHEGRWPANVAHDGSEEVLAVFPYSKSEGGDGYKNSMFCGGKPTGGHGLGDEGSAARFFYCAKASREDRNEGLHFMDRRITDDGRQTPIDNPYLRGETKRENHHPTVKPTDLMRWLCRLITPPGGTVLDPFMGSGSTGKAADIEGFDFIGIELDPEYAEIAKARIAGTAPLFAQVTA